MNVITVKRTIFRRASVEKSAIRRFRDLARRHLARERTLEFAMEALLFAIIVAVSAWPISLAVNAVSELLQRAPA
jgi:hypothetical protein